MVSPNREKKKKDVESSQHDSGAVRKYRNKRYGDFTHHGLKGIEREQSHAPVPSSYPASSNPPSVPTVASIGTQTTDIDNQLTGATSDSHAGRPVKSKLERSQDHASETQVPSTHHSQATESGDSSTKKGSSQQQASNKSGSKPQSPKPNVSDRPDSPSMVTFPMPDDKSENTHSRSGISTDPIASMAYKGYSIAATKNDRPYQGFKVRETRRNVGRYQWLIDYISAEWSDPGRTQYLPRRVSAEASSGGSTAVPTNQSTIVTRSSVSPVRSSGFRTTGLVMDTRSSSAPPAPVETSSVTDTSQHMATSHYDTSSLFYGYDPEEKLPDGATPFWDLRNVVFECAKKSCPMRFTQWDGIAVICPRCGPFSTVRYCRKDHLLMDIKLHWFICGELTFKVPCLRSSIQTEAVAGPPMLPFVDGRSSPQRHRQAVWFSTARDKGDYFIFEDLDDQECEGLPEDDSDGLFSPRLLATIKCEQPDERDQFRRCLAVCLFAGKFVSAMEGYLYQMIRDKLRSQDLWSESIDTQVRRQLELEMGFDLEMLRDHIGDRHACPAEWTGYPHSHCQDPTCMLERAEYHDYSPCGRGFERVCQYMESQYWILRANRTTHPTTQSVEDRIRGVGYGEWVVEKERRIFNRGEGWDGSMTGPMEIEGPYYYDIVSP